MSNIKDKLIEIAECIIINNADCSEIAEDIITLNEFDYDHACDEIADIIIENLPELLADSEWVKLPCKVGGIVYVIIHNEIYEAECNFIGLHSTGTTWIDLVSTLYPTTHTDYDLKDFNEIWFLTQAEAEVKLAELKGAKK